MIHFSKKCYCQNIQSVNYVSEFLYLHLENTKKTQFKFIILLVGSSDVRIFGPKALPCSLLHRILWSPTSKENPMELGGTLLPWLHSL